MAIIGHAFCLTPISFMARERLFKFKQFQVSHSRSAMKVGTDAVLLGAWCYTHGANRVLDVGTGCGVIALMVAQRNASAQIEAIDIAPSAIEEASQNFQSSPWSDRLSARLVDFRKFVEEDSDRKFDLIVSNPPYFSNGELPNGEDRVMARHSIELTFHSLLSGAASLLAPEGRLAIVTPADCQEEVNSCAAFAGLHLVRMLRVVPTEGADVKRLLWEFKLSSQPLQEQSLVIEKGPLDYTDEYRNLCRDFYLKF